jgi:hypothetical protein
MTRWTGSISEVEPLSLTPSQSEHTAKKDIHSYFVQAQEYQAELRNAHLLFQDTYLSSCSGAHFWPEHCQQLITRFRTLHCTLKELATLLENALPTESVAMMSVNGYQLIIKLHYADEPMQNLIKAFSTLCVIPRSKVRQVEKLEEQVQSGLKMLKDVIYATIEDMQLMIFLHDQTRFQRQSAGDEERHLAALDLATSHEVKDINHVRLCSRLADA